MSTVLHVTVQQADLEAAIASKSYLVGRCWSCLIVKAMERTTAAHCQCGLEYAYIDAWGMEFKVPANARELIGLFDKEAYADIERILPITLDFEVQT